LMISHLLDDVSKSCLIYFEDFLTMRAFNIFQDVKVLF
jgi:hypothetical protein